MDRPTPPSARPRLRALPVAVAELVLAAIVALLAIVVSGRNAITDLDADTVSRIAGDRPGWLVDAARAVTYLGNGAVIAVLLVAFAVAAVAMRALAVRLAILPLVALALGAGLTPLIKAIVDRPRPPLSLRAVVEHSSGFPSGHSAQSASGWLALGLVLWLSGRGRRPLVVATVVVVSVGVSRVVLAVHSPTDVLGGWALGVACAVAAVAVAAGGRREAEP